MEKLNLTQEWDKVFPKRDKVDHKKVTFHNRAELGFLTIAFDPFYTGESGGAPRYVASPDINTKDFCAAVEFLSVQKNVDPERIGIIGICGWSGMAIPISALVRERASLIPSPTMATFPVSFRERIMASSSIIVLRLKITK